MDGAGVFDLDGGISARAALVAAEVAARYGCTVLPDVVQVVPMWASGLPVLKWDAAANMLRYVAQDGRALPKFNPHTPRAGLAATRSDFREIEARRHKVLALHGEGKGVRDIAGLLDAADYVIRHDHVQLGIVANVVARVHVVPHHIVKRNAVIAEMARAGKTAPDIGQALGFSAHTIRGMAARAKIVLPRASVSGRVSPAVAARRAEVLRLGRKGATVKDLVDVFGVSDQVIRSDLDTDPTVRAMVILPKGQRRGMAKFGVRYATKQDQVPDLVRAGKTRVEMAAILAVSDNRIGVWVRKAGLQDQVRSGRILDVHAARRKQVAEMVAQRHSVKQMAEHLGVTVSIIAHDMLMAGVSLSDRPVFDITERDRAVIDLRKAKLTILEISKRQSLPKSSVKRILSRHASALAA